VDAQSTSFETGFDRPSLDNPLLFRRYADEVAAQLSHQFPEQSGYRIHVKKHEDQARKRHWEVYLWRGWLSGICVEIQPMEKTPHRVRVSVRWDSRLLGAMMKGFFYLSALPLIVLFIALALVVRLVGAFVLTCVVGLVWLFSGSLVMYAFARLLAVIFNNEFTTDTRVDLAQMIQRFPLPQAAASDVF
jgi:hypothetical protein